MRGSLAVGDKRQERGSGAPAAPASLHRGARTTRSAATVAASVGVRYFQIYQFPVPKSLCELCVAVQKLIE